MTRYGSRGRVAAIFAAAAVALFAFACGGSPAADNEVPFPPEREPEVSSVVESEPQPYAAQAIELLTELARVSESIAAVMDRADIESASWREEATSSLTGLRALHDRAAGLRADPIAEPVHEHLLFALAEYDRAAELLAQSIEALDVAKASDAAVALSEAVFALADVRLLLEEL